MSIETFRPFAAPTALSTQRIQVLTTQVQKEDAIITWGSAGTIASPTKDNDPKVSVGEAFKVVPSDSDWIELSRTVQPVKVTDPNNPSNYVVVAQTQAITYGQAGYGQPGNPSTPTPPSAPAATTPPGFLSGPAAGSVGPVTPNAPSEQVIALNPSIASMIPEMDYDSYDAGPVGPAIAIGNGQPPASS